MDDRIVLCVLEQTMTTAEEMLTKNGEVDLVRKEMTDEFRGVVEKALGRKVAAYHSQLTVDPDIGFELFVLE